MRKFSLKKVLFGLSLSLVLAMAIGSFALGETQTAATPRTAEPTSVVAGAFTISGEDPTLDQDYTFTGTSETNGVLTIISDKEMTIKNTSTGGTNDRIVIGSDSLAQGDTVNLTLAGVNINTSNGAAFEIKDGATFNVNIKIADGSENTLTATADYYAGLQKSDNGTVTNLGTLTIQGGSAGNGKLTATGGTSAAGIGSGLYGSGSNITISGGTVTATGGTNAAGIGGATNATGEKIEITGGVIKATGGDYAAGIGGGYNRSGSNITISDNAVVTATGGTNATGIGGGYQGNGSKITISGGTVTATGGDGAAGIGGGRNGSGSNNSITGDNVVVIAESGITSKAALEGFSIIDKGIVFTKGQETSGAWSGTMHSNAVTVTASVKFPADLEVGAGKVLTVGSKTTLTIAEGTELTNNGTVTVENGATIVNEGTVTVENGATLVNEGTITDNGTLTCNGTITTRTHFYLTDGTTPYGTDDYYQIYKAGGNVQKYKDLPNPDDTTLLKSSLSSDKFLYWYYLDKDGKEVAIKDGDAGDDVLPNQHDFYEKRATAYAVTIPTFENGSVTSDVTEAYSGDTVTLTVTPAEGYELQENSLKVMAGTTAVTVTKGADGKYTFTMPDSAVTISAVFEQIPTPTPPGPEPTPTPPGPEPGPEPTPTPEPTPDPSVNPDGGDGSGSSSSKTSDLFMGGMALALLGVATTGAVLVRKRK